MASTESGRSRAYISTFYREIGNHCNPTLPANTSLVGSGGQGFLTKYGGSIGAAVDDFIHDNIFHDLRDLNWPDFVLPGATDSIVNSGKIAYMTIALKDALRFGQSISDVSLLQALGLAAFQSAFNSKIDLFLRPQSMIISQKPVSQVKQTFDGIYANTYGGGTGSIKISGITKIWSQSSQLKMKGGGRPVAKEIEDLEKVMSFLANMKGLIFNFHDGTQTRKWPVILQSYSSAKSATSPTLVTYDINFLCGSFNQKFRSVDVASVSPAVPGLSIGVFPTRNLI